MAFGWYVDGRGSAVFGTHTHIPTADAKILPQGTAYVTDVGMVGAADSVIGDKKEPIIKSFLTGEPPKIEVPESGEVAMGAMILEVDPKTKKETPIKPRVVEHAVVPADVLALVRAGMRSAVTDGSARVLNDLPIPVAGKTGTAQWSKNKANHAWFTGFAPYENPEIAIVVLIEDGGEGGVNAAPVVRETLDWWSKNRYGR